MGEVVKLLGAWPSPYCYRVIWALKLKGIPFEYVEENLFDKSCLVVQHNPVYKKVPILVHAGNPINESMIIIEYLDQIWPQYPLLPTHPYHRALARFWVKYVEDKDPYITTWKIFQTSGEEQEKAIQVNLEMLKSIEEEVMCLGLGDNKFFGGQNIGIVDIALGGLTHWLQAIETTLGIQVFDPLKFPKLHTWSQNFRQSPIISENLPNLDDMVALYIPRRKIVLASPSRKLY